MFFLHFPCPGELLRPLLPRIYSSASVASRYGDNRVPTDLSSALPEETASGSTFSTPHSLSEASPRTVTSREADEYNALRGPSVSTRERDHPGTDSRDPPGSWWGDVAPVVLVARPPVSAHLSFAINAWLMVSPALSGTRVFPGSADLMVGSAARDLCCFICLWPRPYPDSMSSCAFKVCRGF